MCVCMCWIAYTLITIHTYIANIHYVESHYVILPHAKLHQTMSTTSIHAIHAPNYTTQQYIALNNITTHHITTQDLALHSLHA